MFILKKLVFKFLELGLGLKTYFTLTTRNPIFINFRLSEAEAQTLGTQLPKHFLLERIRFMPSDLEPAYWLSYNFYELCYPKKELSSVHKVRCEMNTFVTGPAGKGIYVFTPFVSKDKGTILGRACDLAERLVMWIYGCGKLVSMEYVASESHLQVLLENLAIDSPIALGAYSSLSADYQRFNDISYFSAGRSLDRVNSNSAFSLAQFATLEGVSNTRLKTPFFERAPDSIYLHLGEISYTVDAMNAVPKPHPN